MTTKCKICDEKVLFMELCKKHYRREAYLKNKQKYIHSSKKYRDGNIKKKRNQLKTWYY